MNVVRRTIARQREMLLHQRMMPRRFMMSVNGLGPHKGCCTRIMVTVFCVTFCWVCRAGSATSYNFEESNPKAAIIKLPPTKICGVIGSLKTAHAIRQPITGCKNQERATIETLKCLRQVSHRKQAKKEQPSPK